MGMTHTYSTQLSWREGMSGEVRSASAAPLPFTAPVAFGGTGEGWTPETLLVAAADACTLLTFLAYAKHKHLEVLAYDSEAEGMLGPDEEGRLRFTHIRIRPRVEVPDQATAEKVRALFPTLAERCFIGASLLTEPELVPTVVVAEAQARATAGPH